MTTSKRHAIWVLLIEDDRDIREVLHELLEADGYHVVSAPDGKQGLASLDQMPHPCLIIVDWKMPVMDGEQFLEALFHRADATTHRVVVLSGANEAQRAMREPDVVDVMMKPVDPDQLLRVVKQHCGSSSGCSSAVA